MRDRKRKSFSHPHTVLNAPGSPDLMLVGRNAVREVLRHSPQRLKALWGVEEALRELADLVQSAHVQTHKVQNADLTTWTHTDSHQGVMGLLKEPTSNLDLQSLIKKLDDSPRATVLLLDSIYDPQNFGALMRAAECFGVDAVLWSRNRGAPLSPVARKASVGASELVSHVAVPNLADAIEKLKQASFWVVALDGSEENQILERFTFPERCVLIAGSEGRGVQPLLLKRADFKVKISLYGKIDSLNVSQATSVALYELMRQRLAAGSPRSE